jgi:NADPH:quinone reductase-like Zn-dependent oxidoreductase
VMMKAVVQRGYGSPDVLHVEEVEKPVVTDDRVLLRVRAASLNALDYHTVHGGTFMRVAAKFFRQQVLPIRGVDVSGVVEQVGRNVTTLKRGDEVFGVGRGTFAEYTTSLPDRVIHKPEQLSFEQAACIGVAAFTALQGLRDKGHVKPGDQVLVYGAGGGVGTFAVQIAKALGARVTAATSTRNVETVRALAPHELVDYTQEDIVRSGRTFDVVLDVGGDRSIGEMRRLVKPQGMLVITGADKRGIGQAIMRLFSALVRQLLLKQRVVTYLARNSHDDLVYLGKLVEEGKLCPAIDRTYPLSEAIDAFRYVEHGQARAKVVITVS